MQIWLFVIYNKLKFRVTVTRCVCACTMYSRSRNHKWVTRLSLIPCVKSYIIVPLAALPGTGPEGGIMDCWFKHPALQQYYTLNKPVLY